MIRKTIILIGLIVLIAVTGFGAYAIYYYNTLDLPEIEIREARDRISLARQAESDIYSPANFTMAEMYYDSAITEWNAQNDKLFFLREHDRVRTLSIRSVSYATMAIEESNHNSVSLENSLGDKIIKLNKLIDEYNFVYARIPQPNKLQKSIFKGRLLMTEAYRAYEEGKLQRSETLVMEASALITPSMSGLKNSLGTYFNQVPQWKEWANSAIKKSKETGKVVLIADKYAHELYLYKGGKLLHTFSAEMGPNWIGDKKYKGDNATPEGTYLVKTKKSGRETKYYKALLIDYPNAEDKKRFEMANKAGTLPRGASIGNLIEIHGQGGRGVDWTNGCIALKNDDMDIVYGLVTVNTPVIITGSLKSLDELHPAR